MSSSDLKAWARSKGSDPASSREDPHGIEKWANMKASSGPAPKGLANRNGANMAGITRFIRGQEDKDLSYGDRLSAYVVKRPEKFGEYNELTGGKERGSGKTAATAHIGLRQDGNSKQYSFGHDVEAKHVKTIDLPPIGEYWGSHANDATAGKRLKAMIGKIDVPPGHMVVYRVAGKVEAPYELAQRLSRKATQESSVLENRLPSGHLGSDAEHRALKEAHRDAAEAYKKANISTESWKRTGDQHVKAAEWHAKREGEQLLAKGDKTAAEKVAKEAGGEWDEAKHPRDEAGKFN